MSALLYFVYGSNLDETQRRVRCPTALRKGRATLRDYALIFGGFSRCWGGAVATVVPTPEWHGQVVGGLGLRRAPRILATQDGRR